MAKAPGELVAIVLAGTGHVLAELLVSPATGNLYNIGVSIAFVGYLGWKVRRTPGILRTWGMRRDNFGLAIRTQLLFGLVGAGVLIGVGAALGPLSLPWTFWGTLCLYPIWGVAQQFALQNLLARNIAGFMSGPAAVAVVSSALFGVSHYPRLELVVLTFVGGIFFTLIYRKFPNLWAVGIVHGILGSLAMYLVLKEDPLMMLLTYLSGLRGS